MKCRFYFVTENELIVSSINIYEWGSRVYQTATEFSDWDYIAIVPDDFPKEPDQYEFGNHTYNIEHESEWISKLQRNSVEALECVSLLFCGNLWFIKKQTKLYPFTFNPDGAHAAISERASIAWVKGKKKLTIEKDFDWRSGKKSIWHSLRLYLFGCQLAQSGIILDYTVANKYYNDIVVTKHGETGQEEWEYLKKTYHTLNNNLHSQMKAEFEKIKTKEYLSVYNIRPSKNYYEVMKNV